MNSLSELEMRIISELEEAGEETPTALLNTIVERTGEARELSEYLEALQNLLHLEFVAIALERDHSRRLVGSTIQDALTAIGILAANIYFDAGRRLWSDRRRTGPPFVDLFPFVIDTDAGRRAASEILHRRGYQWWRAKS